MPAFASGVAAVCCSQGEARHSFPRQDRSPTASAVHTLCAQMSVCKTWRQVIQHHGLRSEEATMKSLSVGTSKARSDTLARARHCNSASNRSKSP